MRNNIARNLTTSVITSKEDIRFIGEFDNDLNGENGDEFTCSKALENGFKTTNNWIEFEAIKSSDELKEQIEWACELICSMEDGYDYIITQVDNKYVVTFLY